MNRIFTLFWYIIVIAFIGASAWFIYEVWGYVQAVTTYQHLGR